MYYFASPQKVNSWKYNWVLGNSKNQWPCDFTCKTGKELQGITAVVFLEISKTNDYVIVGTYTSESLCSRDAYLCGDLLSPPSAEPRALAPNKPLLNIKLVYT